MECEPARPCPLEKQALFPERVCRIVVHPRGRQATRRRREYVYAS